MSEPPLFPKMPHTPRPSLVPGKPALPHKKHNNVSSKSRDLREDRAEREIKTSHNPQTFPHGK